MLWSVFQTSDVNHWQHPQGLDSLVAEYDGALIQCEFARTTHNGDGRAFAKGNVPAPYLSDHDVIPIMYSLPWMVANPWEINPDIVTMAKSDPYWFRRWLQREARDNDWWLKMSNGDPWVFPFGGGMRMINPTLPDYQAWVLDTLLGLDVEWHFLDVSLWHWTGYLKGLGVNQQEDIRAGIQTVAQALTDAGRKVIGNGSWEMMDPDEDTWVYPYLGSFGGAMTEIKTGFSRPSGWWPLEEDAYRRVCADWQAAGGGIWMYWRYYDDPNHYNKSPWSTYDLHSYNSMTLAIETSAVFSTGLNTNLTWYLTHQEAAKEVNRPERPDPHPPIIPPDYEELWEKVLALESQVEDLTGTTNNLDTWAGSYGND